MSLDYCGAGIDRLGDWGHCICSKHEPGLSGVAGFGSMVEFGLGLVVALSRFGTED